MLGTRGVRLRVAKPELYRMQVRALTAAAMRRRREGGDPKVEVMVPLVVARAELALVAGWVREAAEATTDGQELPLEIGTMIETPRAAITAREIADVATFFSFGTNDLTQLVFGFSRDDVAGRVIEPYLERKLLSADPFRTLDRDGVGFLLRNAVQEGRAARPDLQVGLCGEHGADSDSVAFCHDIGLDYCRVLRTGFRWVRATPLRDPVMERQLDPVLVGDYDGRSPAAARSCRCRPRVAEPSVPNAATPPPVPSSEPTRCWY